MAKVTVTDPNTKEVFEYYIDDWLKSQLDKKVIPTLEKKDEDYVLVIDGEERSGKSTLAQQIAKYIDPTFNETRMCLSPDEFKQQISGAKHRKIAVVFDEAYGGMGSAGVLSETNRIIKGMVMEMGQKNLFVIIVLPTFYLLDKYVAIWRAKGLLHVFKTRKTKGIWRWFNRKKKRALYLSKGKLTYSYDYPTTRVRTKRRGRFYGKYVINEAKYRKKKATSLHTTYSKPKSDKFMEQRDKLLYLLRKEAGFSLTQMVGLCKQYTIGLKQSQIAHILAKETKK